MALADAAASIPDREQPETIGRVELGPDGGEFTDIRRSEPLTDWAGVFQQFNLDPEVFEIVDDTVRLSSWQQSKRTETGDRDVVTLYSYRALFRRRRAVVDLPALYAAAKARPRARVKAEPVERATVPVFADAQLGKTGRRGGTPELLDRMQEKREKLEALLKARRPSRVLFPDAGDGFENFESGGNPMFTNDLSLAQQMDCYATELYEFVKLAHRFAPVEVMAVPSNHTQWRRGKQTLGRPSDDLGLFVHKQVEKVAQAAGLDAVWRFPSEYDESVAADVLGVSVGLVHGNQFGPGQAVSWWEKQAFGAQAVTRCDVLITGHYHSFGAGVAGINPVSGRERYWLGAPTLDNGSDFYRLTSGRDSEPGMLVFDVTPAGFDLGSLTIL